MFNIVAYRYLYDPDFEPDENGLYYDDTPPCSHAYKHHSHNDSCKYHHSDTDYFKSNNIFKDDKESEEEDEPPPLIGILKYIPGENTPKFPEYPEFAPGFYKDDRLTENIIDTKSVFRKNLETIWNNCWNKVSGCILYCKPLATPLIKFYHKVYIPYVLVNILNLCGGPKHAGRIGRYARISQFFGASLTWGALIALIVIVGFTSVWTLGLAAPLWALILGFGGIGINMAGSMIAAAANHGKIEPFYQQEIKLHGENNALRRQLSIPEMELEHGYLHSSEERQKVHMHRYEHDAQTWVVGSGSSIAASILEFASIAVGLGGIFLMISRFSSVVSLFGAAYVNQDRLSLFKKVISKKINSYYELKHKINYDKHKTIYKLLSETFNDLHINKNHYYSRWVKFYCYRALDAAHTDNQVILNNSKSIKQTLINKLEDLLEKDSGFPGKTRFHRDKLRKFHVVEITGLHKLSDFDEEISALESMPVLEGFIRNSLENKHTNYKFIDNAVNKFQEENMYVKDESSTLFILYLKSALLKASQDTKKTMNISSKNIEKAITNLDFFCAAPDGGKKILNKEKISRAYPLKGPHGAQIIADYHTKILVDNIIIPTLKNIVDTENISHVVDDFYQSDMNKLDASSSLFILHLKCALIEHSIKEITKEKIQEAVKSAGDLFNYNIKSKHYKLNKEKIAKAYENDDQQCGSSEPDDPARELVRSMIIPYLKEKRAPNVASAPRVPVVNKVSSLVIN